MDTKHPDDEQSSRATSDSEPNGADPVSQQSPAEKALTRRRFVYRSGQWLAGAAAIGLGGPLGADTKPRETSPETPLEPPHDTPPVPTAVLGRTGAKVSILGLGTALLGEQNRKRPELPKLIDVFSEAIDRGVTYVDTARIYGRAEEALRTVLAKRRKKVFLATKVWAETAAEAEASLAESLKTMAVDHVDCLHLHSNGDKDTDKVLGEGGAWDYLLKAKKEGKCRFVGITGHSRPARFVRMLETDTVDVMMVVLNFVDSNVYGFDKTVLPVAKKHKTGVMAMKVYGGIQGGFRHYGARTAHPAQMEAEHHERSIAYVKSLEGVAGMVIGVHSLEQLRQNIERVVNTKPLDPNALEATRKLGEAIAKGWTPRFGPVA